MKLKRRKTIAALAVTGVVAASGLSAGAIASAQSSNGGGAGTEAQEAPVAAPAGAISSDQAAKAAEQQTGQTASAVTLDDENGTVIYEVQSGNSEVKVDPMSGQVTKVESADNEDNGADGEVADESGTEDNGADGEVADDDSRGGQQGADNESNDDQGADAAAGSGQ